MIDTTKKKCINGYKLVKLAMRYVLLILLLLSHIYPATAIAQQYRAKVDSLLLQLPHAASSKAKVDILNKIAETCQRGDGITNRELDSCVYYGRQALGLSKKIHYMEGYWRALDRVYDGYDLANNVNKAFEVIENIYDTHVVKMLYSSAAMYRNSIWRKTNTDSALVYYRKALMISQVTGDQWFIRQTRQRIIFTYITAGDTLSALNYMKDYEKDYTPSQIAATWQSMGRTEVSKPGYNRFKLSCYRRALEIYRGLYDKMHTGEVLSITGDVYNEQGDIATAEQYYLEAIGLLKQTDYPGMYEASLRLHDLYYYKGDLDKAVYYSLEAVRSAERYNIKDIKHYFLYDGNTDGKPLQVSNIVQHYTNSVVLKNTAKEMVREGKAKEALDLVLATVNKAPNFSPLTSLIHAEARGI